MKFSIIIPVYNSEKYIKRCIDSFINQTYDDYELILVDDGSQDDSYKICKDYSERYNNVILLTQKNSGPSAARNYGLSYASGDYILFADSDDWVSDNYFKILSKKLEDCPVDILLFGRHGTNDGDCTFSNERINGHKTIIRSYGKNYRNYDYNSPCNKAYRKNLFSNGKLHFVEGTVVEEDFIFNLDALNMADSIQYISDILYIYNQRDFGSVTTKYNPKKFECKIYAFKKEISYAKKWDLPNVKGFFEEKLLIFVSAAINNLLYDECPLTKKEKYMEIKRFYNNDYVRLAAVKCKSKNLRVLMMKFLIQQKLISLSYLIHKAVKVIKR